MKPKNSIFSSEKVQIFALLIDRYTRRANKKYKKFFPCHITGTLKPTHVYIFGRKSIRRFSFARKTVFWISVKILITDRALRVEVGKGRKVFTVPVPDTRCARTRIKVVWPIRVVGRRKLKWVDKSSN